MTNFTDDADHRWVRRARPAGRPLIFAHRGGSGLAPENTWPAFEQAHALGVDGFELDVHVSRDGEVMVIHDADLYRTTDSQGRVSSMTADELSRVDAGYKFQRAASGGLSDGDFPFRGRGVRIPKLRDLLTAFRDELIILELKTRHPIVAERALAVVRETDSLDRVCFGGFSWQMLRGLRAWEPHACSSASQLETRWSLYGSWAHIGPRWARSQGVRAFQVPEMAGSTRVVSPRFIKLAHAAGLLVQVWTVNEEADMRRLAEWGVDGLITDRPDRARQIWPAAASRQSETAAR
jgi:glycerophosphoryl diester phosphodiesterase